MNIPNQDGIPPTGHCSLQPLHLPAPHAQQLLREVGESQPLTLQAVSVSCLQPVLPWSCPKALSQSCMHSTLHIASRTPHCCSIARVPLFATPWTIAHQGSLSFTISWSLLRLISIESMMPSNHLILCRPHLLLPSVFFPASGSFPLSQLFAPGDQSIGASASASVLPINIQG